MQTDFLVIGSGIAGLTFAIDVSAYGEVTVITKKDTAETNTNYAQGGIAAAFSDTDSIELHIKDTLEVGEGLCKLEAVKLIATQAPSVIIELSTLGVDFTKTSNGKFDLGIEGGHSERRVVHTKDATGKAIETTLIKVAKERGVNFLENCVAVDLICKNNRCIGAWVLKGDEILPFFASSVLIATGGIGNIYLHTTNPVIATGDGIAMAYRAGTAIANMEFVQFHPTSFYGKKIDGRAFLLSEAVRGEGGVLKTVDGHTFMEKYDHRKELAPRDIVARAIHSELKRSGDEFVFLDITHLSEQKIKDRFPTIYESCYSLGVDITKEPIPVVPAAHYVCGGILVDIDGRTERDGLFAAGEVACTGVHGANRLASNSLLESIVFAHRAAKVASCISKSTVRAIHVEAEPRLWQDKLQSRVGEKLPLQREECPPDIITDYMFKIRKLMWDKVGIIRNDKELNEARDIISQYKIKIEELYHTHKPTLALVELLNAVTTAELIIKCALQRKESRGLHYNTDYPFKDDLHYKKDTIIKHAI